MKNLAVFVSGSGTNMENIAVHIEQKKLTNCKIAVVVSDNSEAPALKRAENHKLKTVVICRKDFKSKEDFEAKIISELKEHKIDFIILAGFMRILGKTILEKYRWKIINIHPAFLPEFPGAHAVQDFWNFKPLRTTTGGTIHFVDAGIDTGDIIEQWEIKREEDDTIESLTEKIHQAEYEHYPQVIQKLVNGELHSQKS